MTDPIPLRATSLHDAVAARLRALIFERRLEPGQWIDEKAFARDWQVSRTPLREALKVLAAEGLVEPVAQRGCRVVGLGDEDVEALFPVMALLEGRCAHDAAANASDADIAGLKRIHDAFESCAADGDVDGCWRVDHEFHSRVQALAANRWLDRITGDLRRFMWLIRRRPPGVPGLLESSLAEHRELIDAFDRRDAERAARAMHDHLMAQLDAWRRQRAGERLEDPDDAR